MRKRGHFLLLGTLSLKQVSISLAPIPRKRYPNIKSTFNAMDASIGKLEELSKKIPKDRRMRTGFLAVETDTDPGEVFNSFVRSDLAKMSTLAEKIGGDVHDQMLAFEEAVEAETGVISYAASVSMPPRDDLIAKCEPLTDCADDAVEYNRDCDPSDPKKHHFQALADLSTMLGWVVAPNTVKHVKEYNQVIDLECDNILSNFIQLNCDPVHSDYATAIKGFTKQLHDYVVEYHPAGLRWNYLRGAAPEGYHVKKKVKARKDAHPFLDFLEIIDGPVAEYVYHSDLLGGPVAKQSRLVFGAFCKEYELITRAAVLDKGAAHVSRMYVMPVMYEIAEVGTVSEEVDREDPFYLHLKAAADVTQVLSWVVSTETTASMFTMELANASELLLDRILKDYESHSSIEFHRLWVESLRSVLNELKIYVTVHHYHELSFNTQHSIDDVNSLWREREVNTRIRNLKTKNKGCVRHWTPGMRYLWGSGVVTTPQRKAVITK
uniref:CAP N-terminal domain-containing protein n=1 Tax=Rhodosorus marinus TaxID=101924 RepID=A0A7S0BHW4_9RHOD|mmetsp:Transcript_15937/g.23259  ORF Transcript_15937/g.23259 Transcript_15937/m.23259 type:complete len:493 (+) Transcript_15937:268-1746(+)